MKLVCDLMGSDKGAKELLKGVQKFLDDPEYSDAELVLVGSEEELKDFETLNRLQKVYSHDVMPMEAGALEAMRKRDSSMFIAFSTLKENNYDGVISAGSTGAFISLATIKMRLIEGIERAALVSPFPTKANKQVTILDIGANNENTAAHIYTFAKMGRIYSQNILNVKEPKLYLLSNGAEEHKGSPEGKEVYKMLKDSNFPSFMGNIEGRDALTGVADIIVTDGYSGNVLLKTAEGTASMMNELIKKSFRRSVISKIGYLFAKKGFDDMRKLMDYKSFGGAMLLGINGVAVKAHGSSDAYSFYCALKVAYKMVKSEIVSKIATEIKSDNNE